MAKVIAVGKAVNNAERAAIAHLRDNLPDSCILLHNFEVHRDREHFEVDLALLTPGMVYLIDVKGTRGEVHVYGSKWYPDGRTPFTSPLLKLRAHARALKGMITESGRDRRELQGVFVDAAILLTAPDARLEDSDGRDRASVTTLKNCHKFFQDGSRRPGHFDRNIREYYPRILSAIQGRARPKNEPLRFGHWTVTEKLGHTDHYREFRAVNQLLGDAGGTVLLRVYSADPYLPQAKRQRQMLRITNAYRSLANVPPHPCVVDERDFFATEGEEHYVLVTEDPHGHALQMHIKRPNMKLGFDRKVQVARDLLSALDHMHGHDVVHRNLFPGNIMLGLEGRTLITHFDYARGRHDPKLTIAREIVDDLEKHHQAPEVYREPSAATPASDVFSLGLILYELFTDRRPFESTDEVYDREAAFPKAPSEFEKKLTSKFDAWLQMLCSFDPEGRPSAGEALRELESIV
jgi:serine/threonine protein kinase